jgi:hypothetical protein
MGLRRTLLRWGLRFGLLRSDGGGGGGRLLRVGCLWGMWVFRGAGELRAEDMSVRTLS